MADLSDKSIVATGGTGPVPDGSTTSAAVRPISKDAKTSGTCNGVGTRGAVAIRRG